MTKSKKDRAPKVTLVKASKTAKIMGGGNRRVTRLLAEAEGIYREGGRLVLPEKIDKARLAAHDAEVRNAAKALSVANAKVRESRSIAGGMIV